jgi:hypothetical protein
MKELRTRVSMSGYQSREPRDLILVLMIPGHISGNPLILLSGMCAFSLDALSENSIDQLFQRTNWALDFSPLCERKGQNGRLRIREATIYVSDKETHARLAWMYPASPSPNLSGATSILFQSFLKPPVHHHAQSRKFILGLMR